MNYASEATLPAGVLIGTKYLHTQLTARTSFMALAADEAGAHAVIKRALGETAAQNSFTFGADELHRLFRSCSPTRNDQSVQSAIDVLTLTNRRLGSIEITGAALTFVDDNLRAFWVETQEGVRSRVLAADALEGEIQFDVRSLAAAIVQQY